MPRKLTSDMSLDTLESEVMFTQSMLRADPSTADLAPTLQSWQARISDIRSHDQQLRQQEADVDASRIVGNSYLDHTCTRFGDELLLACGKDRTSPRWTKFFAMPVSDFIKQSLSRQVSIVQGWLTSTDEVLEKYRANLTTWTNQCATALQRDSDLILTRGQLREEREKLATDLTDERDGLHRTIAQRAREQGLDRSWPDQFFRVERRRTQNNTATSTTAMAVADA